MVDKDKDLISALKAEGKKDMAFKLLVKTYQQRLYWHIRKIVINHDDADDLLQNVFIKVWKNIGNFREDSSLFTWLFRIATNESLSFLQQKKRRNILSIDGVSDYLVEAFESDAHFEGEELQKLNEHWVDVSCVVLKGPLFWRHVRAADHAPLFFGRWW